MPLQRETNYGKITISDKVFEDAIARFCQQPGLYDRIWLAQRPNIRAVYSDEGEVELSFSVYVRFGQSIKEITKVLSDKMANLIKERTGLYPSVINVNVSGVRSQSLVKRNMDLVYEYEN